MNEELTLTKYEANNLAKLLPVFLRKPEQVLNARFENIFICRIHNGIRIIVAKEPLGEFGLRYLGKTFKDTR